MRLTPKQQSVLLNLADNWGDVFHTPCLWPFLGERGLLRTPTRDEIERHYTGLASDLEATQMRLEEAVRLRRYNDVAKLAEHACYLEGSINDRADDQEMLATLSPLAHETVANLRAKRMQAEMAQ